MPMQEKKKTGNLGDLSKLRFRRASCTFFRGDLCATAAAAAAVAPERPPAPRLEADPPPPTIRALLLRREGPPPAAAIFICRAVPASKLRGRLASSLRCWRPPAWWARGWAGGRLGWLITEQWELLLDGATLVPEHGVNRSA